MAGVRDQQLGEVEGEPGVAVVDGKIVLDRHHHRRRAVRGADSCLPDASGRREALPLPVGEADEDVLLGTREGVDGRATVEEDRGVVAV